MAGRIAVQLPSLNPNFPDYPCIYNISSTKAGIDWKWQKPLAPKRNATELRALAKKQKAVGLKPALLSLICAPQYHTQPQRNPFQTLRLDLLNGPRWISKSDIVSIFGDFSKEVDHYRALSGQTPIRQPKPEFAREHLQLTGVNVSGERDLPSVEQQRVSRKQALSEENSKIRLEAIKEYKRQAAAPKTQGTTFRDPPGAQESGSSRLSTDEVL